MIEDSVEMGSAARFGAVIRDESIRRAVEIAKARYPGASARVVYPIEPEAFFRDPAVPAGLVELEMPGSAAG